VAIFLHGRGRTPDDVLALADRLALPSLCALAPAAPGFTWYPESFLAPLEKNRPQLDVALSRIRRLVEALAERGVGPERVALVGFSQGACLATELVLGHPVKYGALLAFTGGFIGPPELRRDPRGDLDGMPALFTTGDPDSWVPVSRVRETGALFEAMGARVDVRIYPGREHGVNDDEIAAARVILSKWLSESAASR